MDTPLGPLWLRGTDAAITHAWLPGDRAVDWGDEPGALPEARAQVAAYFDGTRDAFDLPLAPEGSPFQRRVWDALRAIPKGETRSYGDVARGLGDPGAARAVGAANGANPIPLLIPCHRVVAADGGLGGFSGSLATKEALLRHEGTWPRQGRLI
ncbi:methylated-DNA--[protein]-cysteine S-methyltransferase [Jannaschia sp. Os4]|nr:methylated-DNA--[protein]-cysteine S-methyltransferase [Jannaschia sp. Os4]